MIRSRFLERDGGLCGFRIQGHADLAEAGRDILCAAVSSAAILTANTLTERLGARAGVRQADGYGDIWVVRDDRERCGAVLAAWRDHLTGLEEDYPNHVQVETTEV